MSHKDQPTLHRTRGGFFGLGFRIALCLVGGLGPLAAQEPLGPALGEPSRPLQWLDEAKTQLFYLPDEKGILRLVPNLTLRELDQYRGFESTTPALPRKPRFVLDQFQGSGVIQDNHADLTVQFQITTSDAEWVRVPLKLAETVLLKAEVSTGQPHVIELTDDGYALWIKGAPEKAVKGTLRLLGRIEQVAGEWKLKLTPPLAAQASLLLRVPVDNAKSRVTGKSVRLAPRALPNGQTELEIVGMDSAFEIAWWRATRVAAQAPAVLETQVRALARVDGRAVRWEANLNLRSFQGKFRSFRLRLPESAKLSEELSEALQVTRQKLSLPSKTTTVSSGASPLVEVVLEEETAGPVEVRLVCERLPSEDAPETPVQFGGFEVLGAARQSGKLTVRVGGEWQLLWERKQNVFRVEVDETYWPKSTDPTSHQYGYEFYAQPYQLSARILRREARVTVEPHYNFQVYSDRVELEARFQYAVHQVGVKTLEIDFPDGWLIRGDECRTNPPDLLDLDRLLEDQVRPLSLPLRQTQIGRFEVLLRAWKRLPTATTQVQLQLPAPRVNNLGPATLAIQPADNVELTPRSEDLVGLSRYQVEGLKPTPAGATWQQPVLRYRTAVATAKFAAALKVHSQELSVAGEAEVKLTNGQVQVTQEFQYQILYEPLSELRWLVPESLVRAARWDVQGEHGPLTPLPVEGASAPAGQQVWQIHLPEPQGGAYKVRATFTWPLPAAEDREVPYQIPLIQPRQGTWLGQRLTLEAGEGWNFRLAGAGWSTGEETPAWLSGSQSRHWWSADPHAQVEFRVRQLIGPSVARTQLAWLQSWIGSEVRRDRVCYRLEHPPESLHVQLPAEVEQTSVRALWDGKPLPLDWQQRKLVLSLPPRDFAHAGHSLELQYRFHERTPRSGPLTLVAPRLLSVPAPERTFWELVLPPQEYLWQEPQDFSPEFEWSWQGWSWQRKSLWSTRQLEGWLGVRPETPGLPPTLHRYLFSTLGDRDSLSIRTAGRAEIVLLASGACLSLGLMLLYLPLMRSRFVLLLLAGAILTAGAWNPGLAPLLAQGSLFGLALTVLSAGLRRWQLRRIGQGLVIGTASSLQQRPPSSLERSSNPPDTGSTATAAMALAESPSAGGPR